MTNTATSAWRLAGFLFTFSLLAVLGHAVALAQGYPTKPIRIIVPGAPGGPPDFGARTMAQQLTTGLGQQVFVENRPGAGGTIGASAAAKSPGDGYTLLLANTTALSISPSLFANPGYDPATSFAPISLVATAPFLVVVHPSLPARSLKELIVLAKAKPGELNFGSGGNGTPLHIGAEMLNTAAGVRMVHVPFKGVAAAINDLLSGRIQVMVEQLYPLAQHIQGGKIRPLAVASARRHPQLPDLPTAAEAGLPGYEVIAWMGLVAPKGTPPEVIRRLNAELVKALQAKEVRDGLFNQGLQPAGNSPEEFAAFITAELARWSRAVKTSGAKVD
jgi:tripartite-type tricarboxylate transporter receptor subunit TctC